MKKLSILISILFCGLFAKAQLNFGIDAIGALPNAQLNNEVDYGLGGNIYLGFTIKEKIDLSANYGLISFFSMHDTYNISSATFKIKYLLLTELFKPYIGFEAGKYYKKEIPGPGFILKDNGIGYAPSVGILFDSKLTSKLFIDVSASYVRMNMKHKYEVLLVKVGLNYKFRKE